MHHYVILALGVIAAGAGGELFVRGAAGLGRWARISSATIGVTIAAFATSSPECFVGISAALMGTPRLSLGDALGSNVVNIALVLGVSLMAGRIHISRGTMKRDLPMAILVPVIIGVLAMDGEMSRADGIVLLGTWAAWMAAVILDVRRQRRDAERGEGPHRFWPSLGFSVVGLVLLVAAGLLVVEGARGAAVSLGINEYIIGAVIVAGGTSVPEFATAIISIRKGYAGIGYGTVLGSNIFNGLFIVGTVAAIHPIRTSFQEIAAALIFGGVSLLLTIPLRKGTVGPWRGILLLALYALYLTAMLS